MQMQPVKQNFCWYSVKSNKSMLFPRELSLQASVLDGGNFQRLLNFSFHDTNRRKCTCQKWRRFWRKLFECHFYKKPSKQNQKTEKRRGIKKRGMKKLIFGRRTTNVMTEIETPACSAPQVLEVGSSSSSNNELRSKSELARNWSQTNIAFVQILPPPLSQVQIQPVMQNFPHLMRVAVERAIS